MTKTNFEAIASSSEELAKFLIARQIAKIRNRGG